MTAMTITDFLEARIAEDEAEARAATPGPWLRDSGWSISAPSPEGWDGPYVVVETPRARNDSEFVASHDPSRVLAECAAKRAIIEKAKRADVAFGQAINPASSAASFALTEVLHYLAAVYSSHDDYDSGWAL